MRFPIPFSPEDKVTVEVTYDPPGPEQLWLSEIIEAERLHAIPHVSDKGRAVMETKKKGNERKPAAPKTEEQIITGSLSYIVRQRALLSEQGRTRLSRMLTGFLSE